MSWHKLYLCTGQSALSVCSIALTQAWKKSQWPDLNGFQQFGKSHGMQGAASSKDLRENGLNVFKVIFIN